MAPATLTPPQPPAVGLTPYLFTVKQYQKMEEVGVFGSDRVELIEGCVVWREPMGPRHNAALGRANRQLAARVPPGHYVRVQMDVALTNNQPIPDGAVVVGVNDDDYADHHPAPADVALIVEVSDSTLDTDQTTKLRLYARDRIVVYWIVNIPDRQLEVYTQPGGSSDPTYHARAVFAPTDSVTVSIAGAAVGPILVADLLPPV
jgi:Uma2 family endonuclease